MNNTKIDWKRSSLFVADMGLETSSLVHWLLQSWLFVLIIPYRHHSCRHFFLEVLCHWLSSLRRILICIGYFGVTSLISSLLSILLCILLSKLSRIGLWLLLLSSVSKGWLRIVSHHLRSVIVLFGHHHLRSVVVLLRHHHLRLYWLLLLSFHWVHHWLLRILHLGIHLFSHRLSILSFLITHEGLLRHILLIWISWIRRHHAHLVVSLIMSLRLH